ncbi:MAG: hypothetical protein F4Y86_19730 [Gammaproteobacteria bacterium]|nr:hypothetical protein [Gammaproteobacteria bacterium]MYB37628.1 hypothetical protein [Gammaproteobacteria bacterium]
MGEWLAGLSALQQTLLGVAGFSTGVYAIQTLLTLTGVLGDADGGDAGADGDGISFGDLFTVRNGVSFLMGFSWGALMATGWGVANAFLLVVVGLFGGSAFVGLNLGLLALMAMLESRGNVDTASASGADATVTLTVPASRRGVGKVTVAVSGRLMEYHAVTDDGAPLARGSSVVVREVSGNQLVVGKRVPGQELPAGERPAIETGTER